MAKINARGATKVATWTATCEGYDMTFVLTSDGRVLRKWQDERTYTIFARLNKGAKNVDVLHNHLTARYENVVKK